MAYEELIPDSPEMDHFQREERCEKTIKVVSKAIFMRLAVTGILIWALLVSDMEAWVVGLMVIVMLINLSGLLPLVAEWKRRRAELNALIAEEE